MQPAGFPSGLRKFLAADFSRRAATCGIREYAPSSKVRGWHALARAWIRGDVRQQSIERLRPRPSFVRAVPRLFRSDRSPRMLFSPRVRLKELSSLSRRLATAIEGGVEIRQVLAREV